MPMVIGILIVLAFAYQCFFRYDTWTSEKDPDVRYEHDNLTGETYVLKPDAKTSVFARIVGSGDDKVSTSNGRLLEPLDNKGRSMKPTLEPLKGSIEKSHVNAVTPNGEKIDLSDHQQVERVSSPVPVPREVVVASSAPPVPVGNIAALPEETAHPFAVRQVDLDQDGASEEIIQNAEQPDGLLDISIVKNGREIFFGRGQRIALLPTRNGGWADIALKNGARTLQVFRYDVQSAVYKAIAGNQG